MWNDEDNNPYGNSFDRRDSFTSSSINPSSPSARDYPRFDQPHTPSSVGDDAHPGAGFGAASATSEDGDSDDDYAHGRGELVPRRKPGGYDSRVEQILYENPELPILITGIGRAHV